MVPELLIVLVVVLVVIGASRLPALGRSLGRTKGEFEAGRFDPVRPDPDPPPED